MMRAGLLQLYDDYEIWSHGAACCCFGEKLAAVGCADVAEAICVTSFNRAQASSLCPQLLCQL